MLGDLIIPVDSFSISLGMELSIARIAQVVVGAVAQW